MNSKKIGVLLVDDHQIMRYGLRSLIAGQDDMTVVGAAGDGATALDEARSQSPDVVIMDIHLKDESGIEVSRVILAENPSVKIIAYSSDSDLTLVNEALHAGVSGYVTKENTSDELIQAIRSVLDHRVYLSPGISTLVVNDYIKIQNEQTVPVSKPTLTDRELQLLKLVAEGRRNKEIAEALDVTVKSVETYRARLMKKLGCASTNEMVRYAIREGVAPL